MAAIPASNSCYCRVQLVNQGRTPHNLSFSRFVSIQKLDRHECRSRKIMRLRRLRVQMQQTGSPTKSGTNGQPSKVYTNGQPVTLGSRGQPIPMVPISEAVNNKPLSKQRSGTANGSVQIGNGTSLVKREITPPLVKSIKFKEPARLPPSEELRVLPSDEGFRWEK